MEAVGTQCQQAGTPVATGARPGSQAVRVFNLYETFDARLRMQVIAVWGDSCLISNDLRHLGFSCREVSGKRANGGPGHRVPHAWIVPKSRWESDPLLRTEVALLLATHNGGSLGELAALTRALAELKRGRQAGAPAATREDGHANAAG